MPKDPSMICEMVGGPQDGYTLRLPGDKPLPQVRVPVPNLSGGKKLVAEYVFSEARGEKWLYSYRTQVPV